MTGPAVELSVSRLRDALWEAGPAASAGGGPGAVCGRLFHTVMAGLLHGSTSWQGILGPDNLDDDGRLRTHAYERLLAPLLDQNREALAERGKEVLHLWQATAEACQWLCRVLVAAEAKGWVSWDPVVRRWRAGSALVSEHPLRREFHRDGWTAPVRLSGIADAVLRDPATGRWCVIEFKLSDAAEDLDLAQTALYHLLLGDPSAGHGNDIAVVRFLPRCTEMVIEGAQLEEAQEKLILLAAQLAGVREERDDKRQEYYEQLGQQIRRVLEHFGVKAEPVGEPVLGPAFVRYQWMPGRGVPVRKVLSLADDLGVQLQMAAPMIHIEEGMLVTDVPRLDRQPVPFLRLRQTLPPLDPLHGSARLPLGVDLGNQLRFLDMAASESPHLLVAGTSGSGKSEFLRMALAGLLLANTPDTLRVVLIDPKRNAFTEMAGSPFLLNRESLIYPPDASAVDHLDLVIEEMEKRFAMFYREGVDDLPSWRNHTHTPLPRIVCIADEFADLVIAGSDRKQFEERVTRLGAKARSAGIHLILATQHPDAKTVTGRLQSNLSVRVCLKTTTWQQSMVALKQRGAERLLGRGDLLFSAGGELLRLQAPLLTEHERRRVFQPDARRWAASPGRSRD